MNNYICLKCGKNFKNSNKGKKFCSLKCRYESQIKPKIIFKCKQCGKNFTNKNYHKEQIFCSNKCHGDYKVKNRKEIICLKCGKKFKVIPHYKYRKYCSDECFNNRSNKICICNTCGKEFKIANSRRLSKIKFCSRKCFNNRRPLIKERKCLICGSNIIGIGNEVYCSKECSKKGRIKKLCKLCNQEFNTRRNSSLFCSKKCKNLFQIGENHPLFNNYSSLLPYDRNFNKNLKKAINKRDGCCMLCNISLEDLRLLKRRIHIHHCNYNKLISLEQNLITLCASCHGKTTVNRKHWTKFFQSLLSERYNYKYDEYGNIIIDLQENCKEVQNGTI